MRSDSDTPSGGKRSRAVTVVRDVAKRSVTRQRAQLAAVAAAATLATACGAAAAQSGTAPAGSTASSTSPKTTPSPSGRAHAARARTAVPNTYRVAASESFPAAKREAVRAALALINYAPSDTAAAVAARVTANTAQQRALVTAERPLRHAHATSTGTVVYPQMGGATSDQASVIVVVRQVVTTAGSQPIVETRSLDVRVAKIGGSWHFAGLASAGGSPVARPATLSAAAVAVLDDPRIVLTDSARWDIYRGAISTTLLRLMTQIAARTRYAVTVLETGHPYDVFGTTHESLHSAGRAMDINLLGATHVIDEHQPGSAAYDLVRWLLTQPEVSQVGSPWVIGAQPRSFTNAVHLDHIHVST